MTVVAYTSRVRIERLGGPERLAYLPAEEEPAAFGVHSEVAEHYGRKPRRLSPSRDDAGLCRRGRGRVTAGTFAGALETRHVDVHPDEFDVVAVGEIVLEEKTLVIKRIVVTYRLGGVPDDRREEVERVHGFHRRFCPVAIEPSKRGASAPCRF